MGPEIQGFDEGERLKKAYGLELDRLANRWIPIVNTSMGQSAQLLARLDQSKEDSLDFRTVNSKYLLKRDFWNLLNGQTFNRQLIYGKDYQREIDHLAPWVGLIDSSIRQAAQGLAYWDHGQGTREEKTSQYKGRLKRDLLSRI